MISEETRAYYDLKKRNDVKVSMLSDSCQKATPAER